MHPQKRGRVPTSLVVVRQGHVVALASGIGKLLLLLRTIGMEAYVLPRAKESRNRPGVVTSDYAI